MSSLTAAEFERESEHKGEDELFPFDAASDVSSIALSSVAVNANNNSVMEDMASLGRNETLWVARMKVCVVTFLAMATLAVCLSIQMVLQAKDGKALREKYNTSMYMVAETLKKQEETRMLVVGAFAAAISADARTRRKEWPFYTAPHWNEQAEYYRTLVQSPTMGFVPFVTAENREEWEQFALDTREWIDIGYEWDNRNRGESRWEDLQLCKKATGEREASDWGLEYDNGYATRVFAVNGSRAVPVDGRTLLAPYYHFSPLLCHPQHYFFNWDLLSSPTLGPVLRAVLDSKQASIGHVVTPNPNPGTFSLSISFPYSVMFYPVFDDPFNRSVVATVSLVFDWSRYFAVLLDSSFTDLVAVLDHSCTNSSYTFNTTSNEVRYQDDQDLHNREYEEMVKTYQFATTSVASDFCPYTVRIYPSDLTWENVKKTSMPISVFTLSILAVFALTSLVFFVYDYLVQHRHSVILSSAGRFGKILASLFPTVVRARVVEGNFTGNTDATTGERPGISSPSGQIAKHFPNVTVLFADLVGFTSYCSTKTPQDIFMLLETLFKQFDFLAQYLGIYKVETIGDCYMAVAGLPRMSTSHAVSMALFSQHLLLQTKLITTKLASQLGPETKELAIRVGLHSGSVIAGVLRTSRSRFQLFGDTVNLASRMESTGVPGMVQVSQETAKELIKEGKQEWITKREDRVEAKGKGLLQTFFVVVPKSELPAIGIEETTDQLFEIQVSDASSYL